MVFDRIVINKLKIIIFVVGIIIGSFSGALVLDSNMAELEKSLILDGWKQIEANTFLKETSGEVLRLSVKPINMNEFMIVYYY